MSPRELWDRYQRLLCTAPSIDMTLDVSRMTFDDAFLAKMEPAVLKAFANMDALEKGEIVNPDENRMVGHYWLRTAELAPDEATRKEIPATVAAIKAFAAAVHSGKIKPQKAAKFTQVISIGIGGSALGPEFIADALGDPATDKMEIHFVDNTDPDGIDRVLRRLGAKISEAVTVVMSKSGGTPEPSNGQALVAAAYKRAGLDFPKHAVAVTMAGSKLDKTAASEGWLKTFPMWDWVGGRTSELSAVGLVPGFLQGFDMEAMLAGAHDCDVVTRVHDTLKNPAAMMALACIMRPAARGPRTWSSSPTRTAS